MYKHRLRVALNYYEELTHLPPGELPLVVAQEEMERLKVQIGFFQHERLIHLIVTVLFSLATVFTIPFYLATREIVLLVLGMLFITLLAPYIVHYFNLENGVQTLYLYYNKLELLANPGYKAIY